jgi:hypothetical protein
MSDIPLQRCPPIREYSSPDITPPVSPSLSPQLSPMLAESPPPLSPMIISPLSLDGESDPGPAKRQKLEGNMANAEEDALTIAPDVAEYAMPLHH